MPFSCVPDHQIMALKKSSKLGDGLVHKISDSAIGFKPFDCFILKEALAYLVVGFEDGKNVWMVPIEKVWPLMVTDGGERKRGSLSLAWFEEVGELVEGL